MIKKILKVAFISFLVLIGLFQVLNFFNVVQIKKSLRTGKHTTTLLAVVYGKNKIHKSSRINLDYKFFYTKFFLGTRQITAIDEFNSFPFYALIIFDSTRPENNYLLVTESDYEYFRIPLVDSMKSIVKHFE